MTDDDITYLLTLAGGLAYAGGTRYNMTKPQLRKFVEMLIETEREACAKVAGNWPTGRDDVCSVATATRERENK